MRIFRLAVFFGALCAISLGARAADYRLGIDQSKLVRCTNATSRTDGAALAPSQIDRVEVTVTGPGGYVSTIAFAGGCAAAGPQVLDFAGMEPGTYDQRGVTFTAEGGTSVPSASFPFVLLAPWAAPNPPTVTE